MELKDTVPLMESGDWRERFMAEYLQAKIRYDRLYEIVVKYEACKLDFTPACTLHLLEKQLDAMGEYIHCLRIRAEVEGIPLEG